MSDVSGVSSNKKPMWMDDGPDAATKTLDANIGDKLEYKGTTKAGVEDAKFDRNLEDFEHLGIEVAESLLLGGKHGGIHGQIEKAVLGAKIAKFVLSERKAVAEGKKTFAQVQADTATFTAKLLGEHLANRLGSAAGVGYVMMKAICSSIPKMIEDQKADEQLYHDEAVRLHVAKHFESQMPPGLYAQLPNGMSQFGQTYRTKGTTFDDKQAAFEAGLKASPALNKDIETRFWHGKAAAIELGITSGATLATLMNPLNKDPKAVAFRKAYADPTNVAFRMGVDAMAWEATHGDAKSKELYEADLAKYKAEQEKQKLLPQQPVVIKP